MSAGPSRDVEIGDPVSSRSRSGRARLSLASLKRCGSVDAGKPRLHVGRGGLTREDCGEHDDRRAQTWPAPDDRNSEARRAGKYVAIAIVLSIATTRRVGERAEGWDGVPPAPEAAEA
jgi:hypothetical protein